MRAKSGFTLVEILIVVVILGILAAIVIPQFTDASTEARTSSLCSDLQTLRSQIELYKVQHADNLPGVVNGTVHTSAIGDINAALTSKTNIKGDAPAAGEQVYGPYMQKIPSNPFNNLNTIRVDGAAAGADTDGWRFDAATGTGNIQADDTGSTADGTAHTAL